MNVCRIKLTTFVTPKVTMFATGLGIERQVLRGAVAGRALGSERARDRILRPTHSLKTIEGG